MEVDSPQSHKREVKRIKEKEGQSIRRFCGDDTHTDWAEIIDLGGKGAKMNVFLKVKATILDFFGN